MANTEQKEHLTYHEIKERLRQPIPRELVSLKPAGNKKVDYVNITDCKDLMDNRIFPEHWDSTFVAQQVLDKTYICWVRVRIHAFDGIFEQDGVGEHKIEGAGYGSASTNAYAQAFRRACEGHGLSRELWRGELSEEQMNANCSELQIKHLHIQTERLNKNEADVAEYYSNKRTDLFGELTQGEAEKAIESMKKFKTPTPAAKA